MSTIRADNFSDRVGTKTVPASAVTEGTAKAWGTFNAVTPAILSSYNVASLTDNGTGFFTPNWTNGFTSITAYGGPVSTSGLTSAGFGGFTGNNRATGSLRISLRSGANAASDNNQNDFSVFGELA